MKKTILLSALFFILLSCFVFAIDQYYINENDINYIDYCLFNDSYCSANTECNLTIFKPDNSILVEEGSMDNNLAYYSYSLTYPDGLDTEGLYTSNMICYDPDNSFNYYSSNDFFLLNKNLSFSSGSRINHIIVYFVIALSFLFFILYYLKSNIVLGFSSATLNILVALVIWVYGMYSNVIINQDTLLYYLYPKPITSSLGFILVAFALWLFYYSAMSKENIISNDGEYTDID